MTRSNIDIVRETYEAFARGDLDTVLANFDENIEWIEPDGYFPGAAGPHRGVQAVADVLSLYPTLWAEFGIEPEEFIDAGDRVIVTGTQEGRTKADGRPYRGKVCNIWTLRDGKATRLQVFTDTALIWKALGGHPGD